MICFPNAKINIGLDIVEKRPDNFHNIETVFFPIGLSDILEVVKKPSRSDLFFNSSGLKIPRTGGENLCLKAYSLIKKDFDISSVNIHLHKIIPIGAGLGGGSSDAAFFINLIDILFSLDMPPGKKLDYAGRLGSDCSFFIENKVSLAFGKGEKLEPLYINQPGYYLVLICPPIHVSTKEAYASVVPAKPDISLKELILQPIRQWKKTIHNQFENTVFIKFPGIKKIKTQLYNQGADYASMSGSGSSVYGFFESEPDEKKLKKLFSGCFVWKEQLK